MQLLSHSKLLRHLGISGVFKVSLFLKSTLVFKILPGMVSTPTLIWFISFSVVWGFDEQTVKVLTEMQQQQGFGSSESDHSNVESFTKYQVLISSGIYGQKPSAVQNQVSQPAVANQEVTMKCVYLWMYIVVFMYVIMSSACMGVHMYVHHSPY